MNGGTQKIGLWSDRGVAQDEAEQDGPEPAGDDSPIFGDHHYEEGPPDLEGGRPWLAIGAAALLCAGWLILFGLSAWAALDGAAPTPALVAQWIAAASAPLALIGVVYILFQRNSRAEARRFGRTAAALRSETAALEAALAISAARLEENRARLAQHIADLVARGDEAARNLAAVNTAVEAEGEAIERHSATLTTAATAARADMAVLLASLPKAHAQTRDMVSSLQEAGSDMQARATALQMQLAALAEQGREADAITDGAAQRLNHFMAEVGSTSSDAGARMEAAAQQMREAVDTALTHAAEAVDAARQSMEAQADAMRAMVEQSRAALERAGIDSAETLGNRLSEMGARVDALALALARQDENSRAMLERLTADLAEVDSRLAQLDSEGVDRAERLSAALVALQGEAERLRLGMIAGGESADAFTAQVDALLVALDSSAREIDETLPAAFKRLRDHARQAKATVGSVAPEVDRLESATETALARLAEVETLLANQHQAISALVEASEASLQASREQVAGLDEAIVETDRHARDFAEQAGPLLIEALLRVRETGSQAADKARAALANVIPEASERLGRETGEALERALAERVQDRLDSLAATAERAVAAAEAASERLRGHILTVAETSASIENRIADARAEAANQDGFARRVALLIESLNSTAIDVAKILSNEVTDSAWAAYLRGDRGVFARRAVRLLDNAEVKEIVRHYDADPDFRGQVNRYIHDFEAMLRTVLATRDGSALGVTLLSSDNGKLYVALAQAIERLRT